MNYMEKTSMERMHEDIVDVRNHQLELLEQMSKLSTDVEWMKNSMDKMNDGLNKCGFCRNPNEIKKILDHNTTEIQKLKDTYNKSLGAVVGVSATVSFLTSIVVLILRMKDII